MELKQQLNGINLYLVGMMGAGKSTVGKVLAKALGYKFFDTDSLVEAATGQRVSAIFAEQGEAAFRQLEANVLAELSGYPGLVIATGGGIVTQPLNWSYLHYGIVVWLNVPLPLLQRRLSGDQNRPLLQHPTWKTTLATLLEQRLPLYSQADIQVDITAADAADTVAARALEQIQQRVEADAAISRPQPPTP